MDEVASRIVTDLRRMGEEAAISLFERAFPSPMVLRDFSKWSLDVAQLEESRTFHRGINVAGERHGRLYLQFLCEKGRLELWCPLKEPIESARLELRQ